MKYDLPSNNPTLLDSYNRYMTLYLQASKTSSEISELATLQNTLSPYLITASDWNGLETDINVHTDPTSTSAHVPQNVGLGNVDNVKQLPIAGGTLTGIATAQNNTSYTTKQVRNITLSTGSPSGGSNGDVWITYTP